MLISFNKCSISAWTAPINHSVDTMYTVDATEFVTSQTDATFHEGRGNA